MSGDPTYGLYYISEFRLHSCLHAHHCADVLRALLAGNRCNQYKGQKLCAKVSYCTPSSAEDQSYLKNIGGLPVSSQGLEGRRFDECLHVWTFLCEQPACAVYDGLQFVLLMQMSIWVERAVDIPCFTVSNPPGTSESQGSASQTYQEPGPEVDRRPAQIRF